MTKPKQITLRGEKVADINSKLDGISERVIAIEHMLWEFLGSRQAASSQPPMSSPFPPQSPPAVAGELPPSIMPFLKKKSETAYEVADQSILEEDGKLKLEYYRAVKGCGWAYSPAKRLIWKPKEMKP